MMRKLTIVYSDQNPFNPKPQFVRVEARDDESTVDVLDRYNIDPHEIFYTFEGHCNTEDEKDCQQLRVYHAVDVLKDAMRYDPQYTWMWHSAITAAMVDSQISADKAHSASILLMRRMFDSTPIEPRWFSLDEFPTTYCTKYEVMVAVVCAEGKISHVIVDATYDNNKGWSVADDKFEGCEIVLWRFLPYS